MEAKELRIGNLVHLELGLPSLDIHTIKAADFNQIDDKVLPIPLTEEWLLKFGLEFNGFEWELWREGLLIVISPVKVANEIHFRFKWGSNNFRRLKYVHQLQNLYFALTGEELTLKSVVTKTK